MSRILLVDDHESNRYLLRALLIGHGHEVDEARHGGEALIHARRLPPDLVISDLLMPVMDGYTLLRQWKLTEPLQHIPFVVYTATYTDPKDEQLALDLGADAFIVKPTEPEQLLAQLQEVLAQQSSGSLAPSKFPPGEDKVLLKQYNEVLIHRLEIKTEELERANRELECDITVRKRVEEQLREQASLLDKARDAILVRDLDGRITYWNKSAERLYGWTTQEALGRLGAELLYKDITAYEQAYQHLLKTDEWAGELPHITKDGRNLTVESHWTLVRDAAGQPKSVLAINTDITERKKLEAQFLRTQRMESIGTLAGGIAHDLNNVLAPILMAVEILKGKGTDAEGGTMLGLIEESARRAASLVQQVLSFARGVEGQCVLLNPVHLVRDLRKIIEETFPKNIDFGFQPSRNLWTVTGDATQLYQVLLNLCINARDAMPQGGRLAITMENIALDEVYANMNPEAKPGNYVLIQVNDSGTGIPPEVQDRIFEPFFTTKAQGKGTGLGLSTVYAIVKSHGGFISLYSELGRGATFKVYLPANSGTPAAAVGATKPDLPRGNGELVLIVDDEKNIRLITKKCLEQFGYRVLLAANGAEAVVLYAQHRTEIAVVLTDMAMPVMDGTATISALKSMNPKVRIIASSGHASIEDQAKTKATGVRHFIPKPYTAETILKGLAEILQAPV